VPRGPAAVAGAIGARDGAATASTGAATAASRPRGSSGASATGRGANSALRAGGRREGCGVGAPPPGAARLGDGGGASAATSTTTSFALGAAMGGEALVHALSETSPASAACKASEARR
jgi:hypothetical protein